MHEEYKTNPISDMRRLERVMPPWLPSSQPHIYYTSTMYPYQFYQKYMYALKHAHCCYFFFPILTQSLTVKLLVCAQFLYFFIILNPPLQTHCVCVASNYVFVIRQCRIDMCKQATDYYYLSKNARVLFHIWNLEMKQFQPRFHFSSTCLNLLSIVCYSPKISLVYNSEYIVYILKLLSLLAKKIERGGGGIYLEIPQ